MNIEDIKERLKTASQGPWKFDIIDNGRDTDCGGFVDTNGIRIMDFGDSEQYYPSSGDAPSGYDIKFIENAHADIHYLLSIIEQAEKALSWFAKEENYKVRENNDDPFDIKPEIVIIDGLQVAQTALKSIQRG